MTLIDYYMEIRNSQKLILYDEDYFVVKIFSSIKFSCLILFYTNTNVIIKTLISHT